MQIFDVVTMFILTTIPHLAYLTSDVRWSQMMALQEANDGYISILQVSCSSLGSGDCLHVKRETSHISIMCNIV